MRGLIELVLAVALGAGGQTPTEADLAQGYRGVIAVGLSTCAPFSPDALEALHWSRGMNTIAGWRPVPEARRRAQARAYQALLPEMRRANLAAMQCGDRWLAATPLAGRAADMEMESLEPCLIEGGKTLWTATDNDINRCLSRFSAATQALRSRAWPLIDEALKVREDDWPSTATFGFLENTLQTLALPDCRAGIPANRCISISDDEQPLY